MSICLLLHQLILSIDYIRYTKSNICHILQSMHMWHHKTSTVYHSKLNLSIKTELAKAYTRLIRKGWIK